MHPSGVLSGPGISRAGIRPVAPGEGLFRAADWLIRYALSRYALEDTLRGIGTQQLFISTYNGAFSLFLCKSVFSLANIFFNCVNPACSLRLVEGSEILMIPAIDR